MPSSDYTSAGGGLKLKGAKPAGVEKKRKKSKKDKSVSEAIPTALREQTSATATADLATSASESTRANAVVRDDGDDVEAPIDRSRSVASREPETRGKTEAERRHEEMKRKRLDERLKREGVKTHKEKVEQLNKYLSALSEHHDMPRIGPG